MFKLWRDPLCQLRQLCRWRGNSQSQPRLDANTFLLWEPCSHSHAEVVPGFTRYLRDLGYSVSVLMTPERIDEGVFSLFAPDSGIYLNRMSQRSIRQFLRTQGIGAARGLLVSTLTDKIALRDIPLKAGQQILVVSHDVKADAVALTAFRGKTITLRRVAYDATPAGVVAPDAVRLTGACDVTEASRPRPERDAPVTRAHADGIVVNPHYFGAITPSAKNDVVNFITVGALRDKRRNAAPLLAAVQKLHAAGKRAFSVTVIGKGRLPHIDRELRGYFQAPGRVDFHALYAALGRADFYLPLLDPENPVHERYITTGTSGSFQLIYGFTKPPLIARRFAPINGFNDRNSVIYANNDDLAAAMAVAIDMSAADYAARQAELARYAGTLYRQSLENLRRLLAAPAA